MATNVVASTGTDSQNQSVWSIMPGFRESYPGILALIIIAIFCELPGLPWPITVHHLLLHHQVQAQ